LIGTYGLDSRGNGARLLVLEETRRRLIELLAGLPGIWIENKRTCFTVHYRQAPPGAVRAAGRIVRETLSSRLRIMPGKKVWEVLPRDAPGKGSAVLRLLQGMPRGTLAIYAGDDTSDEDAFTALAKRRRG